MKKIIAVDGPAGAGKSTVSKIVAAKLGYTYIDTGAMYRAVGFECNAQCVMRNAQLTEDFINEITRDIDIKLDAEGKVFVNGKEVTKKIRTPEVSKLASDVSKFDFVRKKLTDLQRKMAAQGKVIMDGRDIGTVVLPDADLKIFLTASIEERARRRFDELSAKGQAVELSAIKKEIAARDKQDSERKIAPLKKADDAILLDTTNLSVEEVVNKILDLAR